MRNTMTILFLATTFTLHSPCFAGQKPAETPVKAAVVDISASLFPMDNGSFSEIKIQDGKASFFNVFIGEGNVPGRANQVLVVVKCHGDPKAKGIWPKLRVTAKSDKKFLFAKTKQFCLDEAKGTGKYCYAFWLDDVGTYPITVIAESVGQNSQLKRVLEFSKGE